MSWLNGVPADAIFEAMMGVGTDGLGVALYDVSHVLPRHGERSYGVRDIEAIRRQYVHHSGALRKGRSYAHMVTSARYAVSGRDWPGFPYHTWQPFWDTFDMDGNRVVFRGNPDEAHTFHGGKGPNERGIAHVLQGNLSTRDMSEAQVQTLPVTLAWFARQLGITAIPLGHFQVGADGHAKPSCPGRSGKAWCQGFQAAAAMR